MKFHKTALFVIFFILLFSATSQAQMERKRANVVEPVDAFSASTLITLTTTSQLPAGNLNSTIMHSFGIATDDAIRNFFGLDNVQNVRIGVDIGLTDRWSIGIGRSSQLNVVDLRTKYAVIRQNDSGHSFSLSLKGDIGIITQENNIPFEDDISTLVSVVASRKFNEAFSLQLSPMYAHFNRVATGEESDLFAVGIGSEFQFSDRYSLIAEYYPVFGDRLEGTQNAFSLGLNIETGGHVFQLFLTSTEWHLEQFVLANNDNQFWAGDFRFGFNINRVFGL